MFNFFCQRILKILSNTIVKAKLKINSNYNADFSSEPAGIAEVINELNSRSEFN